jgi:hypothetical protein
MQEVFVVITIVAALIYLGKKVYEWLRPKQEGCEGCAFGKASQE